MSLSIELDKEARKWREKAIRDLKTAKMVCESLEPFYDIACYHAQQSAEKVLKALLIKKGIQFAYKHDLDYLASLLPGEDQQMLANLDLGWLSAWVTEARYPGDAPEATKDYAEKAIALLKAFCLRTATLVRATEQFSGSFY